MRRTGKQLFLSCLVFSAAAFCAPKAEARHHAQHGARLVKSARYVHRYRHHGHIIQCVAYVHQSTDFRIHGNARDWWGRAAGLYARGHQPEPGAVLAFRPTRRMPLGHVAVVRRQIDSRTIMIDQSHWGINGISRNTRVVDVSPANDWTAVRVALRSNADRLGSIYPTHGFIYHRADGTLPLPRARRTTHSVMAKNDRATAEMETASIPTDNGVFDDDGPIRSFQ